MFAQVVLECWQESLAGSLKPPEESPKLLQVLEASAPGNLTYGTEDQSDDEGRDQGRVFAMPCVRGITVQVSGPRPEVPVLPLRVDDESVCSVSPQGPPAKGAQGQSERDRWQALWLDKAKKNDFVGARMDPSCLVPRPEDKEPFVEIPARTRSIETSASRASV